MNVFYRKNDGFTLVELSIVLVILGLLVGGVLTGQSLIRAAELRSVTTQYNGYITATNAFRDKYFALPGDMTNATAFWGTAGTCPGTSATPSTSAATCNGNGDGLLTTGASQEIYRYWQHLANAGLIEGMYSGVTGGAVNNQTSLGGTNVPRSKIANVGFTAYNAVWASDANWPDTNGNFFLVGQYQANEASSAGAFKPEEAWNIDTKIDDGKPATGRVKTAWNSSSCVTPTTSLTASYALSSTATACQFIFMINGT